MATTNVTMNESLTFVKVANAADDPFLVSCNDGAVAIEFATATLDVAPVGIIGHSLKPGESMTRTAIGAGFVFARCVVGNAVLIVSK